MKIGRVLMQAFACVLLVACGVHADRSLLQLGAMRMAALPPRSPPSPEDPGMMAPAAGMNATAEDPAMAAWSEFLNTTNGTKGALFFANATGNVTDAAPPCFGEGLYHLSCYSANLNLTDIGKAKLECLTAWMEANPNCTFSIDLMGKYSYGCGKFAVYHFPTLECHQSYQKEWEKTNPACKLYTSSGLGEDSNRDKSVAAMTDYMCAMPAAPA